MLLAAGTLLLGTRDALADDAEHDTRSTYGELGIIDMPSAHMAPDGQLAVTAAMIGSAEQRYNFTFQMLPWLEGAFRYSRLAHVSGADVVYDRSFGLKARLSREDEYWPDISMGIRDILGTGQYAAEYFVASKHIGDVDLSTGLGWGRLGTVDTFPNPLGLIFPSFKTRAGSSANGGTVNFGQFFHGPGMGLFGGAVWHTPIENLSLLAEYSSDKYANEVAGGHFKVRSQVNLGASYNVLDLADVSAGWLYGTTYSVSVSFHVDPTAPLSPQRIGPDIPQPVIRPVQAQMDALSALIARDKPAQMALAARPWVQLPVPTVDTRQLTLESALMSEERGVRGVDIMGGTLVVDAHLTGTTDRQCDRYATVVSSLAPKLKTIALSDLNDPSGKVAVCTIPHNAKTLAEAGDDAGAASPADMPPPTISDPLQAERKIRADIAVQSLHIEALKIEPAMVWIYFTNNRYHNETEAVGRIARVLMADAPPNVEVFHIVSVRPGDDLRDFTIARSALERATLAYGTSRELGDAIATSPAPLSNPILESAWDETYPKFHWKLGPGLRTGFFDPDVPLQIQVLAAADASVDVTPNLTLEGRVEANIYNNFDLNRNSNSLLPHVRSDLNLYLKDGINGIANLDAIYHGRFSREVFYEFRAGYLEDMFAGAGGQVLWRPEGERVSFGADLYEVWQRDFDRLFGVQNYHVLTGHVSMYYQSPWYGLNLAVHAGRYLAGDYGATFEVTRQFSSGIEIGAFATFTNVPFSKFGEGSFDKGLIIRIPLEWALPFYSTSEYDIHLRSLIRDGGQRLDNDDSLFDETRATSYGQVMDHVDDVLAP
ncbi:MAG TPA: YjbH domain-containing protein [Rhizomicrobium sp.]|nr:YjbH domain-containing protein [Rhizomicrobium sp.]